MGWALRKWTRVSMSANMALPRAQSRRTDDDMEAISGAERGVNVVLRARVRASDVENKGQSPNEAPQRARAMKRRSRRKGGRHGKFKAATQPLRHADPGVAARGADARSVAVPGRSAPTGIHGPASLCHCTAADSSLRRHHLLSRVGSALTLLASLFSSLVILCIKNESIGRTPSPSLTG